MPLTNSLFTDERATATINLWLSNNYESLFLRDNAFWMKLRQAGRIITQGFGIQMVEPVMSPAPSGASPSVIKVSDPYSSITHTSTTGFTGATYTAAEYLIPVSVPYYDLDQQGSDTRKVNYLQGIIERNLEVMMVTLEADLWANEETTNSAGARNRLASIRTFLNAGSVTTNGASTEPNPLPEQVGNRAVCGTTSATAVTTVGGINRNATEGAYWCTPIINTSMNLSVQTLSKIRSSTRRGGRAADLIIMHRDSFDRLQGLASLHGSNGGQFFRESRLARLGFEALGFQDADIITDDRVPTTCYLNGSATTYAYNIFAINTRYIKLCVKTLKPQMEMVPDARPIKAWLGRWLGQLTSSHLGNVHCRAVNISNA